jgi:hypothetical protein
LITLQSNDNIPHALLAFNWLENHTLNFDNFRGSHLSAADAEPYYFDAAPNGHLTSTYPIGTSIVSFPLYVLFFIYLKLAGLIGSGDSSALLHLTSPEFDITRRFCAKLAGTICTALSVVLFYLSLRFKFSRVIALLTAFTYAFATTSWALNSQDLRQHTVANLLLTGLILALFKVDRTAGKQRHLLLFIAGCFCGLLPSVRLTSAIFVAAAIVYAVYVYRKQSLYLLLGLPSIGLNWLWNSYYFGLANFSRGGYLKQFESGASSYKFSLQYFTDAFWGQIIGPSDGLFVFSPVLLFAIPGFYVAFRRRAGNDEKLILCLGLACLGLFLHYCFYAPWDGGAGSYGPRFLTDILPVACFLVGYALDAITHSRKLVRLLPLFLLTLLLSTVIQTIGAFSDTAWGKVPLPLITYPQRRWGLEDTHIERNFRNLIARIAPPIRDPQTYTQQLAGKLNTIEIMRKQDRTVQPIPDQWVVRPGARIILKANLTNTGQVGWFGYQTGLEDQGETRLQAKLINQAGQTVKFRQDNLFISGTPQPGETATALGLLSFPRKPGDYQLQIGLIIEGKEKATAGKPPLYTHSVTITPKS